MEKIIETADNLKKLIQAEKKEKFDAFRAYLLEFNGKYNLTAITEEKDMLYKHFVDSLAAVRFFSDGAKVAEIGSGAGFPSLPLKIVRDDLSFDLFESVGKKCDFLRFIVDKLDLKGMNICNIRAEGAARDGKYREKYDYAVARAADYGGSPFAGNLDRAESRARNRGSAGRSADAVRIVLRSDNGRGQGYRRYGQN